MKNQNQNVIINGLTVMPILPGRMTLNASNEPMVTNIKKVTKPTFAKQVPRIQIAN